MTENKVTSIHEARVIFDLLGIKDVTKDWQSKKGTQVFELPFKTMYYNGSAEINRFSIYKNGYVRKMVVHPDTNGSRSCYQLNKQYRTKEKWWNSHYKEYQTWNRLKRIMIDNHEDRVIYLCNYILKNYYRNSKYSLVGDYTRLRVGEIHGKFWRSQRQDEQLPFEQNNEPKSVQVIIDGHRYNLN